MTERVFEEGGIAQEAIDRGARYFANRFKHNCILAVPISEFEFTPEELSQLRKASRIVEYALESAWPRIEHRYKIPDDADFSDSMCELDVPHFRVLFTFGSKQMPARMPGDKLTIVEPEITEDGPH